MSGDSSGTPGESTSAGVLAYQLDLLKVEIGIIQMIVDRIDCTTQGTKNWAVVTWVAAVGLSLQQEQIRPFIAATAVLPILFWYIDGVWRHLQRRSTYRMLKIGEFLNGDNLVLSFQLGRLQGFTVMDPVARQYRRTQDYEKHVSLWRTLRFREVAVFYAVPALISIFLGVANGFLAA